MSFKYSIILFSVLGLLYAPVKILISNNNLVQIHGTVEEVEKTTHRKPYYMFKMKESPDAFYNSGNGLLSYIKNDQSILYNPVKNKITFSADLNDSKSVNNDGKRFYIGLDAKSKFIDLYYYNFTSYKKFLFVIFCMILLFFNTFAMYKYKLPIFRFMISAFVVIILLILLL